MKQLGIYIHIPFCVKKCVYCDFLSFPADNAAKRTYMAALQEEIRAVARDYSAYEVRSVFFWRRYAFLHGKGADRGLSVNRAGAVLCGRRRGNINGS